MNKLNPLYIIVFLISILVLTNSSFSQHSAVDKVEAFFNSINTLSAKFIQLGPENNLRREGVIYISKPGKLKWDYTSPKKITMISNQNKVSYYDHEMDELSYIKYDDLILKMLTTNNIIFKDFANIVSAQEDKRKIVLVINKKSATEEETQYVKIIFNKSPNLLIHSFSMLNDDSSTTEIILSDIVINKKINEQVFITENKKVFELNRD